MGKAQQQIQELERTVAVYKSRLRELSSKLAKGELESLLQQLGIQDILEVTPAAAAKKGVSTAVNGVNNGDNEPLLIDTTTSMATTNASSSSSSSTTNLNDAANGMNSKSLSFLPTVPPRNQQQQQLSLANHNHNHHHNHHQTQKMDELLLNSDSDSDFDPRADENNQEQQQGLERSDGTNGLTQDRTHLLFGFEPQKNHPGLGASFGQQLFKNNSNNSNSITNNNSNNNSFLENTVTPPLCE